MYSTND